MRPFITLLFCTIGITTFSQNTIYVGTKSYPATNTWSFLKNGKYEGYGYNATLEVTFAKYINGGYMMLSTGGVFSEDESIGGTVLIYLNNGEVLTVTNRLHKDYVDEKTVVVYSISSSQINKLKLINISQIRYSIIASYGGKSGFTADNRYNKSYNPGVYDEGVYQTARDINELF